MARTPGTYPSDVTDEEWALVAPYLTLVHEDHRSGDIRCALCSTPYGG